MTVIAMDTFEVVKELKAAGFTEAQAEAVTRVVRNAQEIDLSTLATKTDLQLGLAATKADLQLGLAETKAELQHGLAETKADLQRGLAETKADLQRGLAETKAELHRDLADMRAELLKWLLGSMGLQTVVIIGAVLALVRSIGHG